jgi:hypothetical protein
MKKNPKKKVEKLKATPPKIEGVVKQENETAFDFGGLPDRNLKKNLGCG